MFAMPARLTVLCPLLLVLVCSASAHAGVTTFTGGDPGDGLDLTGNFLYAINVGTAGPEHKTAGPYNVGDVTFAYDGGNTQVTNTQTSIINNWANPSFGASPNDDNLEYTMQSIRHGGSVPAQINLGGLTPGRDYQLQLLFTESCCDRGFDVLVEGALVADDFSPQVTQGGINGTPTNGAVVTHTFTAGDTVANIVLDGPGAPFPDKNPILSAFTLEDVSPGFRGNVALGRPTIAGSSSYNNVAFDNNQNGYASFYVTDGSDRDISQQTFWLGSNGDVTEDFVLDLGTPRNVRTIALQNTHNGAANDRGTRDFEIWASNAVDTSNQLVSPQKILDATLTTSRGPNGDDLIPRDVFTAANGLSEGVYRYLQFNTLNNSFQPANVGLGEIQVFEGVLPANVAAGKPVSGTTFFNAEFQPFNITDQRIDDFRNTSGGTFDHSRNGNNASYWLAPDGQTGALTVDLEGLFVIDRIDLQNTHNGHHNDRATADFTILASIDGVNFTTIFSDTLADVRGSGVGPNSPDIPFEAFSAAAGDFDKFSARYIRFTADSFYGTGPGLNEIMVFGVVPEPSSVMLLILGLLSLGLAGRRRRR